MLVDARERYDVPVVEVIRPAVRRAVAVTRTGDVGVIGTSATIESGAYQDAFDAAAGVRVHAVACPSFVDFVERGITSGRQVIGLAQAYLAPLQRTGLDTLVLGCTHYPLLTGALSLVMGDQVTLVSSADETAFEALRLIGAARYPAAANGSHHFITSGDPLKFAELGSRFLGPEVRDVEGWQWS